MGRDSLTICLSATTAREQIESNEAIANYTRANFHAQPPLHHPPMALAMSVERAQQLLAVLDLETLDENFYRGQNEIRGERRLFGGQVLAQALSAAIRTVHEKRSPHSLHGYFLRPGRSSQPVIYQVERIRDGRSFATRRVLAIQQGEAIFNLEASFQVAEAGLTHQATMLQVADPETLAEDPAQDSGAARDERAGTWQAPARPFELRTAALDSGVGAANAVWMR